MLQVPLASLLTCWPELFHALAKKLGRNNKGCSATRQTRATWKSWERASPFHSVNDANLWLWLSLKTPIFRLPSACPESWAGPKHHSTLKPAGKSLTGERNFFSATIEENPQIIPESYDSKRAILSFSTQIRDGEASGLELQAGSWISSRFFSLPWLSSLIFPNFLGWQQHF